MENWIKHFASYHFKCPCCGYQHQPWVEDDTVVKAARVLTLVNPITGQVHFIPCINPPSEDEKWINEQIEITARKIQSQADLKAWYDRSALDLNELLQREALPPTEVFRDIPYNPANHDAGAPEAQWDSTRQKRNGFVLGNFLPMSTQPQTPFSDFNGLIAIMANHVKAARCYMEKSKV